MEEYNIYVKKLESKLLISQWPKCDTIAEELFKIGGEEAKTVLINGLRKGKRHHIRTACMRALVKFNDKSMVDVIEPSLNDSSYDARVEAKNAIDYLKSI